MKRLLLFTLFVSMLSLNAFADDGGQCGPNSTWHYSSADSTMTISGFGAMYDWEDIDWVPWAKYGESTIRIIVENGITTIGKASFYAFDAKYVTLPETVTDINGFAFAGCDFETLTLPNSVKFIGSCAFAYCYYLKSVTLPASLNYIELQGEDEFGHYDPYWCAFRNCKMLETIIVEEGNPIYDSRDNCNAIIETATNKLLFGCKGTVIPNSVTEIGAIAFSENPIPSIEIPESVTKIGQRAFMYCNHLTSVVLPNSLTEMGSRVFAECERLTEVTMGNSLTYIPNAAFENCEDLVSVTFNDILDTIKNMAFYKCESLISLVFPKTLKVIEFAAFAKCSSLSEILCLAETPPTCGASVFGYVDLSFPLYVPFGCAEAYRNADTWKDFTNIIELPEHYGVDDNQEVNISVYPNPATSSVKIECENLNEISIFSADGKEMKKISVSGNETDIDISHFVNGVYVLRFVFENGQVSEKKIVKK